MKRLVLVLSSALAVAALVPVDALAKGATEARIEGPGLDEPIILKNRGLRSKLGQLAIDTGFYRAVFTQIPDPMLAERPAGDLGPRYEVTYVMPRGDGLADDELTQDLYPYARPSPVSYVAPGQPFFFDTKKTRGGWYVATPSLEDDLIAIGLPESPPPVGEDTKIPWTAIGAFAGLGIVLAFAALLVRRRGIVESQEVSP